MKENIKNLEDTLFYQRGNAYQSADEKEAEDAFRYAKGYAYFLNHGKTEREVTKESIRMAEEKGFTPYRFGDSLKAGDKKYYNNRGKNLFLFTVGTEPLTEGIRIFAAHIDSPRLDIKACPLYEEGEMAFLKTHYYGGIRKYQWVTIPLALHGVVVKKDGTAVDIVIGEDEEDPVFYINDLLPHLSREQNKLPLSEAIPGEKLNVLVGALPLSGAEHDAIKLNALYLLHQKYGITEEDFLTAELCVVPAFKARDIGFDRALIGSYGHDDRVCAYPALTALLDSKNPRHTLMCVLADKEEIGSVGSTGMYSDVLVDLIAEMAKTAGVSPALVRANSKCLSADVTAAFEPNYPEPFEKLNTAILSGGVALIKYTGSGGKSNTNDANAEYIGWLRGVLNRAGVYWQTGELGKVDGGGGGTVAKIIANHNIETVDLGVPVISMHAPYEVISKLDLYEAYRAFYEFGRA